MLYAAVVVVSLFGQMETQRLVVGEPERSRSYVHVVLPSGIRTEVPVINGWLPNVDVHRCPDQVELVLDYRQHVAYDPKRHGDPVRYQSLAAQPAEPPRQEPKLEVPRFPAMDESPAPAPPELMPELVPLRPLVPVNHFLRKPSEVVDLP